MNDNRSLRRQRRPTGSKAVQRDLKGPNRLRSAFSTSTPEPHQHMTSTSEFISTHIQGKWHLAAVQSKCDWETGIKVTPACVITLGNVFVCSIYLPKAFGFNICEKSQTTWQYWICVSCCKGRKDKHIKVCAVKVHPCVNKQHVYTVWYCPKRGKHFHTTHLQNKWHICLSGNVRNYANNVETNNTCNKFWNYETPLTIW